MAINSDTLRAASTSTPPRNLWNDVRDGKYQVVCASHEQFYRDDVRKILQHPQFRKRLGATIMDEVHLLAEWKVFRPAFANWSWFRALLPPNVPIAACTATLALGTPHATILKALGFREETASTPANFNFLKLDTERYNIALDIREIKHSVSGSTFLDLEWLIRDSGDNPSTWLKTVVYCETIDLGHRVVSALRELLPPELTSQARSIIRHIHSITCAHCKDEAVTAFTDPGATATCRILVATDVFGVGMDIPDIMRVVIFRSPRTLSSAVQRMGRCVRNPQLKGEAIIYVDKSEVELVCKRLELKSAEEEDVSETEQIRGQ